MSIFLFTRDLRIVDNTALIECCKENTSIIPIFIFTPEQISNNSYKSNNAIQFMIESINELKEFIPVNLLYGNLEDVLINLIESQDIKSIYMNIDYTPYAKKRDYKIKSLSKKYNLKFKRYHDYCLVPPNKIKTKNNTFYKIFSPYARAHFKFSYQLPSNYKINQKIFKEIQTDNIISTDKLLSFYNDNKFIHIHGGRKNALKQLKRIEMNEHEKYSEKRDKFDYKSTYLSAYLKFGCISIRETYKCISDKYYHEHPLVRQLIWRDFYIQLGYNFENVITGNNKNEFALKNKYNNIKWNHHSNSDELLESWKNGRTGVPIIDACMIQLNKTGYMPNRGRLLTASYLVKILFINWREGEKYFATKLIDYDPLVNNGNWQWVTGSGADNDIYNRIFNPWKQGKDHDPMAYYIKKWIPELKGISYQDIHRWEEKYNNFGHITNYPKPLVNFKNLREISKELYKKYL